MRVGLWLDDEDRPLEEIRKRAAAAGEAGFATVWLSERGGWDPLTLLAALGPQPSGVLVGTSIVRSHPRHPLALAAQALTVQAATGSQLVLGVGPGHGPVVEGQYGYSAVGPVANLREYLQVLLPLLRGEEVSYQGRAWHAAGAVGVPNADPPPVFLSALGPHMLRLTGELADGTLTNWMGPRSIAEYVLPTLAQAAAAADRPVPTVVAGVCLSLTRHPDEVRSWVHDRFGAASGLPSYRAVFDREGITGPADTVLAGDETTLEREISRFAAAGVTELQVVPCGSAAEQDRTIEFAATLALSTGFTA
ncbi:TIGR03564 family F420-dependent LLM class oxidoreductase [Frankia tisae]|uniref:TIGR03564 family F420-dependent LLM class oxidoreductase n=1 Tax=Frankia tisae TaxID=2950104 RepID=UPI0021C13CD1|nr:TIGR03564 family F420-dependent LLM class oxidoreductase [Frankia tisae]